MNPTNKTMELIHYGAEKFEPEKFLPVNNSEWIKPSAKMAGIDPRTGRPFEGKRNAGFWASPITSSWGLERLVPVRAIQLRPTEQVVFRESRGQHSNDRLGERS